jgi:hypothetical protein
MTSRSKPSKSSLSSQKPKRRGGSLSAQRPTRQAALAEVKDDFSRFLRMAETGENCIDAPRETRRPADRVRNRRGLVRLSSRTRSRVSPPNRRRERRTARWPRRATRSPAARVRGSSFFCAKRIALPASPPSPTGPAKRGGRASSTHRRSPEGAPPRRACRARARRFSFRPARRSLPASSGRTGSSAARRR